MSTKSRLMKLIPDLDEEVIAAMEVMANASLRNRDNDEDDLPAPRRPGRPAKKSSAKSLSRILEDEDVEQTPRGRGRPRKEAASVNSSRRGPGRPRKDDAPAKRGPGRPRKDDSDNRPAPRKAAATPRNSGATDYSEMSQSELVAAADKIGLTGIKKANLASALIAIDKLANGSKSVGAWEKQAEKANVELVFGRGRPPATEEGLRRRIIVKMVNERALRV
jgi:hypothetical protein